MRRRRREDWSKALAALLWLIWGVLPAAGQQVPGGSPSPRLLHGPPSRPLILLPPLKPPAERRLIPLRLVPPLPPAQQPADPVVQSSTTASVPTSNIFQFPGVGEGNYGYDVVAIPPDANGDVGSTQYVQWVNLAFAVFDKQSGQLLYGPAAGNTLWQDLRNDPNLWPCAVTNDGDPVVQYDQLSGQWVLSQLSYSSGAGYYVCIAISQSDKAVNSLGALGIWYRFAVVWDLTLPDYPKLSVWPAAYFLTANLFTNLGFGWWFIGGQACALDREFLRTNGETPSANPLQCSSALSSYHSLLPADLDGSTLPPDPSTGFLLSLGSNAINLWKFKVSFTDPNLTSFTGPTSLGVAPFNPACNGGTCIPQAGTKQKLDSLADRLMYRLAYRNFGGYESLVVNHAVTVKSGRTSWVGVRWYELRKTVGNSFAVYQQGTYAPDSNFRWMGSIAMDKVGNIAVGYSVSSAAMHPAIRFTGRLLDDPVGLGKLQSEVSILQGTGAQTQRSRWGDYTSMSVDPLDGCTFWYTNQYLAANGNWNWKTQIGRFQFPSCVP